MFIFTLTSRGWHRRGANNRVQSLECDTFEIQFSVRRKITLAETRRSFLTLIVHNSGYAFRNCLVKQLMCRPATMAGISWLSSVHPLTSEILFFSWLDSHSVPRPSVWVSSNTLRHTTGNSSLPDEWSARRRDLYRTIHNTHNRHTSMTPAIPEPVIPASERPQIHALDRAATRVGKVEIVPKTGTFPLSSTSLLMHYLLIIPSLGTVWFQTLIARDWHFKVLCSLTNT